MLPPALFPELVSLWLVFDSVPTSSRHFAWGACWASKQSKCHHWKLCRRGGRMGGHHLPRASSGRNRGEPLGPPDALCLQRSSCWPHLPHPPWLLSMEHLCSTQPAGSLCYPHPLASALHLFPLQWSALATAPPPAVQDLSAWPSQL